MQLIDYYEDLVKWNFYFNDSFKKHLLIPHSILGSVDTDMKCIPESNLHQKGDSQVNRHIPEQSDGWENVKDKVGLLGQ